MAAAAQFTTTHPSARSCHVPFRQAQPDLRLRPALISVQICAGFEARLLERSTIMLKFITSAILAGSFMFASTTSASACDRSSCCKNACSSAPTGGCTAPAAAPAAPPVATPEMQEAPPAPTTAQNSRQTYRSYSYTPAPVYRAPVTQSYGGYGRGGQSYFRADHKMRGY